MCFGCSKELSHRDGYFEYPQHMIWLGNKKIVYSNTLLSGALVLLILHNECCHRGWSEFQ